MTVVITGREWSLSECNAVDTISSYNSLYCYFPFRLSIGSALPLTVVCIHHISDANYVSIPPS
jgi:hypothetical protein